MKCWRLMPFDRGALFLAPEATGDTMLVVLRLWLEDNGLWFPGDDGDRGC